MTNLETAVVAPQSSENVPYTRPLQIIPWAEKMQKDKLWFRNNIDYYINRSVFAYGGMAEKHNSSRNLQVLYDVYNNKFPLSWFSHITDPLSAKNPKHKSFPAKIRPVTILRTNIDLMLGEFPKRPSSLNVTNMGETGYNRYVESQKQVAQQTLEQIFLQEALKQAQANGQQMTPEQMQQLQQDPPVPEEIKAEFQMTYKDAIAVKAQKWLKRIVGKEKIPGKMLRMFKDWLIAGEAYSYKGIRNSKLIYERKSPMQLDYDKSDMQEFVEDGEWVVCRELWTLSDVTDNFYAAFTEQNAKDLESKYYFSTPTGFYSHIKGLWSDPTGKVPVYHAQWKGRKKVGFLSYLDMESFQLVEDIVDEDYVLDRQKGEQVEWRWVNEVYEGFRIGEDMYVDMQALPIQRNEMNNHSTCKLSYNGRKYSDTHSENISVLEIGLPFQILYIILTYTLEKTVAKSKGKILLMDQNTIPDDDDWDEEKFFYYSEALGYALLNRNQIGVDKTWNQYQVLDMSLFDQIEQLIKLQDWCKNQWDDILGITRQRKGQTMASDGQGVNERAVFQSNVITDMIFLPFEEFREREMQGILDLSKFLTAEGTFEQWNDDEYGHQLLEVFPGDFMYEDLGVMMDSSSEELNRLKEMKGVVAQLAQNPNHKISTVMEVVRAVNSAELMGKLRQIEAIDAQIEASQQDAQAQTEQAQDARKKDFMEYESLLTRSLMEATYDRKEDIENLKGIYNTFTFKDGDSNANGTPDAVEVMKMQNEYEKSKEEFNQRNKDRKIEQAKLGVKMKETEHKMNQDKIKNVQEDKKIAIARKKALARPKSAK